MTNQQLKIAFQQKLEKEKDVQLSFADYWEAVYNSEEEQVLHTPARAFEGVIFEDIDTPRKQTAPFDFKLKRRRPLWKDTLIFGTMALSMWGATHVALNYSAFAEIAVFKANKIKTSVVEAFTPEPDAPVELVKTQRKTMKELGVEKPHHARAMFKDLTVYPSDNRIVIPRINKNVPLVRVPSHKNWERLEKNIQSGLQDGVVVHPISRTPGNNGNFFLTGHSSYYAWDKGRYKDVFALLHELKVGDVLEVYWEGKKYEYKLRESRVVPPTETSVLKQPNDRSIITLMTCTPVGTNKNRLIWIGDLVE